MSRDFWGSSLDSRAIESLAGVVLGIVPHRMSMDELQTALDGKLRDAIGAVRLVFVCGMWLSPGADLVSDPRLAFLPQILNLHDTKQQAPTINLLKDLAIMGGIFF